jgi:hypothetical protein
MHRRSWVKEKCILHLSPLESDYSPPGEPSMSFSATWRSPYDSAILSLTPTSTKNQWISESKSWLLWYLRQCTSNVNINQWITESESWILQYFLQCTTDQHYTLIHKATIEQNLHLYVKVYLIYNNSNSYNTQCNPSVTHTASGAD